MRGWAARRSVPRVQPTAGLAASASAGALLDSGDRTPAPDALIIEAGGTFLRHDERAGASHEREGGADRHHRHHHRHSPRQHARRADEDGDGRHRRHHHHHSSSRAHHHHRGGGGGGGAASGGGLGRSESAGAVGAGARAVPAASYTVTAAHQVPLRALKAIVSRWKRNRRRLKASQAAATAATAPTTARGGRDEDDGTGDRGAPDRPAATPAASWGGPPVARVVVRLGMTDEAGRSGDGPSPVAAASLNDRSGGGQGC